MVANKMDAIPKAVKHSRIENWLRKYLKDDENVEILNIHGEGFRLIDKS
jgi:hypothetical protein